MKISLKYFILINMFSFLIVNSLKAIDKYTVVKVLGSIIIKKTGAKLAQGDVILATEPIVFKSPEAKASVISSQNGRFILSATSQENNIANVKSSLLPPMSNISTRSGAILNLNDLKNNFTGNYLVLKQIEFPITKSAFPMNDSSFFYFTYKHNEENINKKLSHKGDTLLIIEKELFKVDGKTIHHPESTLVKSYYYSNKKPVFINEFNIITPDNTQIVKEVKMIVDHSKNKAYAQIVEDVNSYLNEFYGKIDKNTVKLWLKENFKFH